MAASKRVLKWRVLVDDKRHFIGSGKVVHVDCQDEFTAVQVWTEETDTEGALRAPARFVQVFGTGHEIPAYAMHLGSVMVYGGKVVWHVYEMSRKA